MKREQQKGLLKIGELAKAAGVSVSTIHYYVQEGLLTPPTKTSRNMAYYDPRSIQEIRLIQELQSKKFLPLSSIKLILQAKRDGQSTDHILEMESFMEEVFRPVEGETQSRKISFSELITVSGLPESSLKALEARGMIVPIEAEHGATYDDIDIRVAQLFKKLAGFGLKPEDLDVFLPYIKAIRIEAKAMHETFHRLPNHEQIPITELFKTLDAFKRALALRVYRQEAGHFREHGRPSDGGK